MDWRSQHWPSPLVNPPELSAIKPVCPEHRASTPSTPKAARQEIQQSRKQLVKSSGEIRSLSGLD
eukprot:scaffold196540_cov22-Prasinocladus_malaysianus.AAC.1